jgi:fructose-1,6-bisphosphatase/inositol monophosphatase family enzyme
MNTPVESLPSQRGQSIQDGGSVIAVLRDIGEAVCDHARDLLRDWPLEKRIAIHHQSRSDTIYQFDHELESIVVNLIADNAVRLGGVVLVAEGIGESEVTVYPSGLAESDAAFRVLMDPIDGTRGVMYDKRSAFFLAGAAPNKGADTHLRDIESAVMVEISTSQCASSDTIWAMRGRGVGAYHRDIGTGTIKAFTPRPSRASTIRGGFAQFSKFFGPGKSILAAVEDNVLNSLFPDAGSGEILTFEDQYMSSGGQLYELLTGKDRFTADLRAGVNAELAHRGERTGHACHPYDLCAHLIGTELGIVIADMAGGNLDGPFDTTAELNWIGYANAAIRDEVSDALQAALRKHKLL